MDFYESLASSTSHPGRLWRNVTERIEILESMR